MECLHKEHTRTTFFVFWKFLNNPRKPEEHPVMLRFGETVKVQEAITTVNIYGDMDEELHILVCF